jgi:nitrogen fixation protein FixH
MNRPRESEPATRPLTGHAVLLIFMAAFGVIIAVNGILAYNAVRTFPGLEVKNSYVASQSFDAERAAQQALGWTASVGVEAGGGGLRISIRDRAGAPAAVDTLSALIGRPTERNEDRALILEPGPSGYYAAVELAPGKWHLWLDAVARDGTAFRQRLTVTVPQTQEGRG